MPKIIIILSGEEYKKLKEIWDFNLLTMTEKVLVEIGWHKIEDFVHALMQYGFCNASEDPVKFVRSVREEKNPIFRKSKSLVKKISDKTEADWYKAYM
jgi:hypothetical protein